jgi:hypothetical protein
MSPNEGGGVAGSQPMSKAVHMEPINFGDVIPYLTYASLYLSSDSSVKVFNVIKKTRTPVIMIKESYGVQLREVLHR